MKTETKILILLLFLPPAIGELLSGSAPPLQFFNPVVLLLLVLLYGCGTLLIREAKVKWNLQWSVVFLAIAYGIIEEGLMVKSFFNPGWVDMGLMSGYGMYFGVQWAWTIKLTFYHATLSTLIPIVIIDLLWPDYRNVPVLKRRGIILASAGITFVTLLGMVFFGTWENNEMVPYYPNPLLLVAGLIVVLLLFRLAYKYRDSRIQNNRMLLFSPMLFAVSGFMFQVLNLLLPDALAGGEVPAHITLAVQCLIVALTLLFAAYQILHVNVTKRHIVSFISGSLLLFILLAPIHELDKSINPDPTQGMILVGIISLVLLVKWRQFVLKNESA